MEKLSELTDSIRTQPRGLGFTRYVRALATAHGKLYEAREIAEKWRHSTPRVLQALEGSRVDDIMVTRALQSPGTTYDSDWAAPLLNYRILIAEFIDMLRARSILGRLESVRRVPLGVRFLSQSGAATVGWVGEGIAAPVGELSLETSTLGFAKAAGILVVTQELLDSATADAEALFAAELRAAMTQFFDEQLVNPAVSAVANESPASLTNGATAITSTGSTVAAIVADFAALFAALVDNGINMIAPTLIMHPKTAVALALKRTTDGAAAFPTITAVGGTLFGVPVLTSAHVPSSVSGGSIIVLVDASEIIVADPGLVTVDVSKEAALQMRNDPISGTPQQLVSLFQLDLVGIKIVAYRNYRRRRDAAVAYLDGVAY